LPSIARSSWHRKPGEPRFCYLSSVWSIYLDCSHEHFVPRNQFAPWVARARETRAGKTWTRRWILVTLREEHFLLVLKVKGRVETGVWSG